MEKKNQIPKYPHLRFPEFTDEWKEVKLGEVGEKQHAKNADDSIDRVYTNSAQDGIVEQTEFFDKEIANGNNLSGYYIVKQYDFVYNPRLSKTAPVGAMNLNKNMGIGLVSPLYTVFRITARSVLNEFLEYLFESTSWHGYMNEVANFGARSDRMNIKDKDFFNLPLRLPSLPEQRKIAALLSLIDERIEVQNAISNDLESLIVGFYNSVQYVTKAGWHKVRLRDLLTIRKEQNTSGSYEVYSVSVSRGIVNQIVHLGRSFAAANTSNYGVVHPGDLVYTKSPTGQFPFGIVKQNHNASPVAVSPLYGVYRPISPEIGTLLHYFFLSPLRANNYLAPLIQKGAKNTINIRTDHFLDNVVLLPKDEKELRCIADCLLALDERLSVEREYVELLKQQKAYLLRQMFI